MLTPAIIEKPELTVVGCERAFAGARSPDANGPAVIGPLWMEFIPRMDSVPQRVGHASYGVIYAKPERERSRPDELQYLAGVAVASVRGIPPGMVSHTIPKATFAVFIHKGPIINITSTVADIYRDWLPQSGYSPCTDIPDIELYDDRFCPDGADSEMEYWVAIRPLGPSRT